MQLLTSTKDGLKLFYNRITFSRITTTYFIFSVAHFAVQLILQIMAFQINANAASFFNQIIIEGNGTLPGFTSLGKDLRQCTTVPSKALDTSSCQIIWDGSPWNSSMAMSLSDLSWTNSSTGESLDSTSGTVVPLPSSVGSAAASLSSLSISSGFLSVSSSPLSSGATPVTSSTAAVSSTSSAASSTHTAAHTVTVTVVATLTPSQISELSHEFSRQLVRRTEVEPIVVDGQPTRVRLDGLDGQNDVILDQTCIQTLNWPLTGLDDTKREDIVFILFQFWLLGMSFVAIINESVPHIIASLLTHVLVTAWAAFQLVNTNDFHNDFSRLVTKGSCGVNLLPQYWNERARAEIPSLVLNVVALLVSVFLSWRLLKTFGWQTFKRVGASRTISRVYNVVLVLSIVIQLGLFFTIVSASLWLDQVLNGNIGHLTRHRTTFEIAVSVVLILIIPWLALGWTSARREHKLLMLLFLVLSFLYLVGWSSMFISPTFRWTFMYWRFFSVITSASVFLTLTTLVLGIWCRANFGKGLRRHLQGQERLPDDGASSSEYGYGSDEKGDPEIVAFPSTESVQWPLPTYTDAFGPGPHLSAPDQAHFASRTLGPRFYNQMSEPFDASSAGISHKYTPSSGSGFSALDAPRPSSRSSSGSSSSGKSGYSHNSPKRWVIE